MATEVRSLIDEGTARLARVAPEPRREAEVLLGAALGGELETANEKMRLAIRSHLAPDNIEGIKVGDEVYFHVTNL
jgi:nitrous-oxide reductase